MTTDVRPPSRRTAFVAGLGAGAALALSGCARGQGRQAKGAAAPGDEEVTATEDLMREHGVLRRILIVYRETAPVLRTAPGQLDAAALAQAADLFRTFGEDYHERKVEEAIIFPALQKAGGQAGGLVATLLLQHARGREITAFIQAKCAPGKIAAADAEPLARVLDSFARMYEAHTAWEDTVAFPAWKKAMPKEAFDEMGDRFEAIERETFKGDGFDMALDRVSGIEQRLGLHDLARFTAPPAALNS